MSKNIIAFRVSTISCNSKSRNKTEQGGRKKNFNSKTPLAITLLICLKTLALAPHLRKIYTRLKNNMLPQKLSQWLLETKASLYLMQHLYRKRMKIFRVKIHLQVIQKIQSLRVSEKMWVPLREWMRKKLRSLSAMWKDEKKRTERD